MRGKYGAKSLSDEQLRDSGLDPLSGSAHRVFPPPSLSFFFLNEQKAKAPTASPSSWQMSEAAKKTALQRT